jgi:cyclase
VLAKRIIPCLDVKDGRTVKGVNFVQLRDAGDPVELATLYSQQGADELVFLDISASQEKRRTLVELVRQVGRVLRIPFTVGGGISSPADAAALLEAGVDKISINSSAVANPQLINQLAEWFGSQFVVVAVDSRQTHGQDIVYTHGGTRATQHRTVDWCREAQERGAGEILLTSMDHDGTRGGFANRLLAEVNQSLHIPLIASGGAGNEAHFADCFRKSGADAALAAGIFHFRDLSIPDLKEYLRSEGITVRM